jgi:hypothetical protein
MVGWVVLEDAALNPVVGFDGGADSVWRGRGWQGGAVDEDGEGRVGDVRCGFLEPVGLGLRCHLSKDYRIW